MTRAEYKKIKQQVKNAKRIIENHGGFSKVPKHWTNKYQNLAEQLLNYEVEHDLLPDYLLTNNNK